MEQILYQTTHQWHFAFLLTLLVEVPIYILMTRQHGPWWRGAIGGIVCSCVTHPLLWFVWIRIYQAVGYVPYVISGELLVVAIETVIIYLFFRQMNAKRALATSLIANAISCGVGFLLGAIYLLVSR